MTTNKMLSRIENGVGYITFNNPEKHNAVSIEMWDALERILDVFRSDKIVLSADFDINTEKNIWETNFRTSIPGNYVYKVYSKQNKEMIQSTDFKVLDSQIEISQV